MTSRVQWQLGAGRDIKEEQPPGMVYTGRALDSSQYLGQEIDGNQYLGQGMGSSRYLNPQFQVHHEMQGQEQYGDGGEGGISVGIERESIALRLMPLSESIWACTVKFEVIALVSGFPAGSRFWSY